MNHLNPKQLVILATLASINPTTETTISHSIKIENTNISKIKKKLTKPKSVDSMAIALLKNTRKGKTKNLANRACDFETSGSGFNLRAFRFLILFSVTLLRFDFLLSPRHLEPRFLMCV